MVATTRVASSLFCLHKPGAHRMDFLAAQRFIESFIRVPGEYYPTAEQVASDPWECMEWLLSSHVVTLGNAFVSSTATYLARLRNDEALGISSLESEMTTQVMESSLRLQMQVPSRNLLCSLEQVAGSLFACTNRTTAALRVAALRAFWLWLTRHTDHGSGILGYIYRWSEYFVTGCLGRLGWRLPLATLHFCD